MRLRRVSLWFLPAALLAALVVFVLVVPQVRNNLRMNDFKAQLFVVAPPPESRVLDRGTEFGLLEGNSNHCDFLAWMLLETNASVATTERYYDERVLREKGQELRVDRAGSGQIRVALFDSREAGWDLRCH